MEALVLFFLLGAVLIGAWAMDERTIMKHATTPSSAAERARMISLVRMEAARQGVPEAIALAFAEVESDFDANAHGDMLWAEKKPQLYQKLVLENPQFDDNPARTDPSAWHSYGLFQLLAPHHTRPGEHPSALSDPTLNARRGIAFIKALLRKHGDDLAETRLAYAGALGASAVEQERVLARFSKIYQRWSDQDEGRA
jgi:soluble lytic murein transglycosylase-like protein